MAHIIPRILIAGLSGGSGKTFLSLGLTKAFSLQNLPVQPFKKGPDYIDAAWLKLAANTACYNLDPFFLSKNQLKSLFIEKTNPHSLALIEGNRGLFDGKDVLGTTSSAEVAKMLSCPVILSIDCTKMTRTIAALVLGCATFDKEVNLAGVVFTKTAGERHQELLRKSVEYYTDVPVLGILPRLKDNPLPERHMGLLFSLDDNSSTEKTLLFLADYIKQNTDLEKIFQIAHNAPTLVENTPSLIESHSSFIDYTLPNKENTPLTVENSQLLINSNSSPEDSLLFNDNSSRQNILVTEKNALLSMDKNTPLSVENSQSFLQKNSIFEDDISFTKNKLLIKDTQATDKNTPPSTVNTEIYTEKAATKTHEKTLSATKTMTPHTLVPHTLVPHTMASNTSNSDTHHLNAYELTTSSQNTCEVNTVPSNNTGNKNSEDTTLSQNTNEPVRIGYIKDKAFWFYYEENLEALKKAGAELIELSLFTDENFPEIHALYMGGGYPELFASELSSYKQKFAELKNLVENNLPIYAECGGFMYLAKELVYKGQTYPMANILPLTITMHARPQRLGYVLGDIIKDTPFFEKNTHIKGHEFHYSSCTASINMEPCINIFTESKKDCFSHNDGYTYKNVFGTYVHLYALANPSWASNFIAKAQIFKKKTELSYE